MSFPGKMPPLSPENIGALSVEEIRQVFHDLHVHRVELEMQKVESIGSLAKGITHDLNNILFPISGLSEMLLDDIPPDTPEHDSIEQIHKSAQRGSDLVKHILAFSRQSNPQKMPIRIQPVLKESLKLAQATIPKNIKKPYQHHLTMPRMNGWDTLVALRKLSPDTPVILSSGYDEAQVMADEHPELLNDFLGKPYQLKGLKDTISRVLANKA